jgi:putative membrane protein insertion efficiency factor
MSSICLWPRDRPPLRLFITELLKPMQPYAAFACLIWLPARLARILIRLYQLTLSSIFGRHCRHLPSCSHYMDGAISRYGLWAGGWIGLARLCRCHPFGTSGLDFVAEELPEAACWYMPWRYGRWRTCNRGPTYLCEAVDPGDGLKR